MGGTWVESATLKTLGFIDRDLELDKDYCDKYENGTGVYDPNGNFSFINSLQTLQRRNLRAGTATTPCAFSR